MRTKSFMAVVRPLLSSMPSCNLWRLIMAVFGSPNANPSRPASGHDYRTAMSRLHRDAPFACEALGDLATLEKAKLGGRARIKPKSRITPV